MVSKGTTKEDYVNYWLETHGGRSKSDLFKDPNTGELYVIMHDYQGLEQAIYIEIPKKFKTLSDVDIYPPVDKVLISGGETVENPLF